jgi:hypothetical protein
MKLSKSKVKGIIEAKKKRGMEKQNPDWNGHYPFDSPDFRPSYIVEKNDYGGNNLDVREKHQLADDLILATRAVTAWNKAQRLGDKNSEQQAEQLAEDSSKRITKHTGYFLDGVDNTPKEFANSINIIKNLELRGKN